MAGTRLELWRLTPLSTMVDDISKFVEVMHFMNISHLMICY